MTVSNFLNVNAFDIMLVIALGIVSIRLFKCSKQIKKLSIVQESTPIPQVQEPLQKQTIPVQIIPSTEYEEDPVIKSSGERFCYWENPKEYESAIVLSINNDKEEGMCRVTLNIPQEYRDVCMIHPAMQYIGPNDIGTIYVVPKRSEFAQIWLTQKYNPITFTVSYTDSSEDSSAKNKMDIEFTVAHISKHFSEYLKRAALPKDQDQDTSSVIQFPSAY